jgi:predicted permease
MMRRVFRLPSTHARLAREVDDELAFHIETRVQQLVAGGVPPDAARREAERQFGDVESVRRSCVTMDEQREFSMRRANYMSEVLQDLAFALRTLRRNAGFAALVVGALAIGIGANTAIFSMIDAVFVRGLPVSHPEQLVAIGDPTRVNSHSGGSPRTDLLSAPLYRDLRDQNDVFTGVLASGRSDRLDARIGAAAVGLEHPTGRFVSGNYFSLLGVRAVAGHAFDASADSLTGGAVPVTISYGYWVRRFHEDRSAIGQSLTIDDVRCTIVGVAPPSFTGDIVEQQRDMWIPLGAHDLMKPHEPALRDRGQSWLLLLGRLKPGVTLGQATAEVGPLIARSILTNAGPRAASEFRQSHPKTWVSSGAKGFSRVRATFEAPLFTLMIGVALLLCIICANVANLLLARAIARGREMSVRLALGANRARLLRQLLTEAGVLAVLSAAAGLVFAQVASRWLITLAAGGAAARAGSSWSPTILAFTLAVSVLAVGVFGLAPALHASRVDLASTMRSGAQPGASGSLGRGARRRPLASLLISGQVALSVVLLVGAAILVRSLRNLQDTDVGFDRDHLVIVDVDILTHGYVGTPLAELVHTLRDKLAAIPGVAGVSYSENGIFSGTDSHTTIEVPGFTPGSADDTTIAYDNIGPNYTTAIGGRVVAGRDLLASDENKPARTAIVNQSLAGFYFPRDNAIGKFIHFNDSIAVQIVGVIADVRDHGLTGKLDRRMYFPYVHTDTNSNQLGAVGSLRLEVRTVGTPSGVVEQIRRTIVSVDPSLPIDGIDPLPTLISDYIREEILLARLATAFGVLALALAAIGLYGVMSYSVARRTGEIGLRAALGAQRRDVMRLVLTDAMALVAAGLVVGLPLAMSLTRLLRAQLHGVGTADPASIALSVSVLVASAVAAVLVPAYRAARVAPIVALRES